VFVLFREVSRCRGGYFVSALADDNVLHEELVLFLDLGGTGLVENVYIVMDNMTQLVFDSVHIDEPHSVEQHDIDEEFKRALSGKCAFGQFRFDDSLVQMVQDIVLILSLESSRIDIN
jgi:hypothetical protein